MTPLERWRAFERLHGLAPLPDAGAPVFVLATGWRSGSTLVQRLLASSDELLVWGEPYGPAGIIPSLAGAARALDGAWDVSPAVCPAELPSHPRGWIANLYPEPGAMRDGFRAHLDTLLAAPARRRGFDRFGVKEVRLGALAAHFLKWIYPDARFVFVTRSPLACWRSYRGSGWWLRRPDQRVQGPEAFARVWSSIAASHLSLPVPDAVWVRHEDLVLGAVDLTTLAAHCRIGRIDASVMTTTERGVVTPLTEVTKAEQAIIVGACGLTARRLGYSASLDGASGPLPATLSGR